MFVSLVTYCHLIVITIITRSSTQQSLKTRFDYSDGMLLCRIFGYVKDEGMLFGTL